MAKKGIESTNKEFTDFFLETGVSLEYTSANTPQQISIFASVGSTRAAMVSYMHADSGLPKFLLG